MSTLNSIDRDKIDGLFNQGGYVLDFSTERFDSFTYSSVGVRVCERYGLSKGKSFRAFVSDEDDHLVKKLLFDLLEYYEYKYQDLINTDQGKAVLLEQCKAIERSLSFSNLVFSKQVERIKEEFTSDYIHKQIKIMTECIDSNPTEAIGKAKELLESCCKTILNNNGIEIDKDWTVQQLSKQVVKTLKLTPDDVDDSARASDIVKKILGNLSTVCGGIADLRNPYGSGHGKQITFKGLSPRHAHLATGAATTVVLFLWETYQEQNQQEN